MIEALRMIKTSPDQRLNRDTLATSLHPLSLSFSFSLSLSLSSPLSLHLFLSNQLASSLSSCCMLKLFLVVKGYLQKVVVLIIIQYSIYWLNLKNNPSFFEFVFWSWLDLFLIMWWIRVFWFTFLSFFPPFSVPLDHRNHYEVFAPRYSLSCKLYVDLASPFRQFVQLLSESVLVYYLCFYAWNCRQKEEDQHPKQTWHQTALMAEVRESGGGNCPVGSLVGQFSPPVWNTIGHTFKYRFMGLTLGFKLVNA